MFGLTLFAQAAPAPPKVQLPPDWLQWLYVWGEPAVTDGRSFGGLMTWSKVVGLYCLLAWVVAWLIVSTRSNTIARKSNPIKLSLVLAVLVTGFLAAMLGVLDETDRLKLAKIGSLKPGSWLGILSGVLLIGLVEFQLWTVLRRKGNRADLVCLITAHLGFALGYFVSFRWVQEYEAFVKAANLSPELASVPDWRVLGGRIGATFMGLIVLIRVASLMVGEVMALRWRRIYSIAWQSVIEANRSNKAPWVVVGVFIVILAFTHWFLRTSGERDAELSRMFVGTLTLLCSLLLSVMVGFIAPRSMPRDIANQTIYTVVSKPVRRLELIWGRLLGYMVLVTFLLVLFGGISLAYLQRNVGVRIDESRAAAKKLESQGKKEQAQQKYAAADQLESRMSARVPLKGTLTFFDAKNKGHERGIDVGQEQEIRSHIEGATESRAVWRFGIVRDPTDPLHVRDTRLQVEKLLVPESIEGIENRLLLKIDEQTGTEQQKGGADLKAADASRLSSESKTRADEIAELKAELDALKAQEKAELLKTATLPAAERLSARAAIDEKFHSPPIPIEMTFTVYRTTKGVVGEPVLVSMTAKQVDPQGNPRLGKKQARVLFPIREYYTNQRSLPAYVLVGSHGLINIDIRCETANQYLGMAESDLYVLASQGGFQLNFLKGLFGIWLQAMVLTAIGLFAGTFLSWPVAVLTTIAFFVAGEVAFSFLAQFSLQAMDSSGGGPFESLIRLLSHQNLVDKLSPTPAVVVAKTADAIVMPVMSRLVYLVPNFGALDVTETVASGFAVTWSQIRDLTLLGIGYALPFSVAGYFILKNREVAA